MPKEKEIVLYRPRGLCFWRPKVKYAQGYLFQGRRHGKWVFWYKNGERQLEGQYLKGKKTGTWMKWAQNGQKVSQGGFLYGKMHGPWTDWYSSGQKALQSSWVMGKRDGDWTYWAPDGSIDKTQHYDHRRERDRGYSIYGDLEKKEIVRRIQTKRLHRAWEQLVGRAVASLVKPWQVACWVVLFIPLFSLMKGATPWRGAALAGILAFLITGMLTWGWDRRKKGPEED
jgi:hypothetical protein